MRWVSSISFCYACSISFCRIADGLGRLMLPKHFSSVAVSVGYVYSVGGAFELHFVSGDRDQ